MDYFKLLFKLKNNDKRYNKLKIIYIMHNINSCQIYAIKYLCIFHTNLTHTKKCRERSLC